ncbi:cytosolic sulfotransferase 5-like [Macadamia integrifolia]|uniref:cytosolic sulfotransferase 5-like n=1 Tax=Macadamia integrifolia TaxID=60698 RepID=UPI001C4EE5A4|nr:cytosolic sulfotransferase 5-like [Macadamia integrifolia]
MTQNSPYKRFFVPRSREEEEEEERIYKRYEEIVAKLPTTEEGWSGNPVYQYQGFWYSPEICVGTLAVQDHFKAQPSDILIASPPKCGFTWLQSLAFAVMNREFHHPSAHSHPLLTFNSHDLVPTMEIRLYNNHFNGNRIPNLEILPSPRLFGTHMPYTSLPQSLAHNSESRVIYICRNVKDTIVSWWHFVNKVRSSNPSLELIKLDYIFELFCKGISAFGPFWDHVLGYWNASLERPQNVLFLKYDEMVTEPVLHLKRIAEFMGSPFSSKEEREGAIDQIIKLCSFENLSNLDVNKTGINSPGIMNSVFFRKGKVGDSTNYLTPEMMEQLDHITQQKLHGSGLKL